MSRFRIAHVTTIDTSLHYLLLNQLRSIKETGYEVVGISSPGSEVSALVDAGIRHISVSMTRRVTPLADLFALWSLYQVMRREQFTIVHGHTPKAEFLGQIAARLAGVPIVVDTFRGIYYRSDMHPLWRWLFLRMAQIAAACADTVLSQSQEAMDMAIREGVCPAAKIKYLGNGIDVRRFDRCRLQVDMVSQKRSELGIPQNAKVVGFVGRLVAEKGIAELLQAAAFVRQRVPTAHFLFIGNMDSEKADALTPAVATEYNIEDACTFAGLRQDMPELYALMDVFVLPSHRESFPRSPMEATAMKVPCVVSDIPGCREVVEHNRNGLLVPLGNVDALADALVEILADREKALRMGEEGRRMAEALFDEELVFARVKAEYSRLLKMKGISLPTIDARGLPIGTIHQKRMD